MHYKYYKQTIASIGYNESLETGNVLETSEIYYTVDVLCIKTQSVPINVFGFVYISAKRTVRLVDRHTKTDVQAHGQTNSQANTCNGDLSNMQRGKADRQVDKQRQTADSHADIHTEYINIDRHDRLFTTFMISCTL